MEKLCIACETIKSDEDFPWRSKKNNQRREICKNCYNEKQRAIRAADPERFKKYDETKYKNNKDKILERSKKYQASKEYTSMRQEKLNNLTEKCCKKCKEVKNISEFTFNDSKINFETNCKECRAKQQLERYYKNIRENKDFNKNNYKKNRNKILPKRREHRKNNSEKYKSFARKYYKNNKQTINNSNRINYQKNKEKIFQKIKEKYHSDPIFKIRRVISSRVRAILNKENHSFWKYVDYTPRELREHLESQFADWMNWSNWGKYHTDEWLDHDSSTWRWQIDHIIPHSSFRYSSMEDEEFKKCWALSNLRPLSAKENILKGNRLVNAL